MPSIKVRPTYVHCRLRNSQSNALPGPLVVFIAIRAASVPYSFMAHPFHARSDRPTDATLTPLARSAQIQMCLRDRIVTCVVSE